jgi:hypothetical protein
MWYRKSALEVCCAAVMQCTHEHSSRRKEARREGGREGREGREGRGKERGKESICKWTERGKEGKRERERERERERVREREREGDLGGGQREFEESNTA